MHKWRRVWPYFRAELPQVLLATGLLFLNAGANALKPWPLAIIIDNLTSPRNPDWLRTGLSSDGFSRLFLIALLFFALHVAAGLFGAGQNYLSIRAGLKSLARLREELFRKMQRLSHSYYLRASQGDLIYRATWDTYSIQTIFQQGFFKFLQAIVSLVIMTLIMLAFNAQLTLLLLAFIPPILAAMYFFGRAMNRRSAEAHKADSAVTSLVQQNITALPLIQSFTQETREETRFTKSVHHSFQKRSAQHGFEVLYWLVIAILFGAATAFIAWQGGQAVLAGTLTIGTLVVFMAYLGQLYEPLNQLTHVGSTLADARAGLGRIYEVLDATDEVTEKPNAAPAAGREKIQFTNVTFGYLPDRPVLHNISLEINPGETIALIGPSGAGKSTLLNLVPRFYDPTSGQVRLGDHDLRDLSLNSLRSQVGYVFQEPLLLPATVAENIGYGRPNATRAEIEHAAHAAHAADFIARLPQAYDTIIGEGAARLSQGEKQRLNIARAFLKNAPILLLDEPTSALDAESEAEVVASLTRLMRDRTTLLVAHRLSTIEQVTRIVVLDQGRIIETGPPSELRSKNGYFARVANKSFGKI